MSVVYKNRSTGWWVLRDILSKGEEFHNTTNQFRGLTFSIGTGQLPQEWATTFKTANPDYIIYSYGTPIAWKIDGTWVQPDVKYSLTTTRHQNKVATAISQL